MKKISFLSVLFLSLIFFASCTKKENKDGNTSNSGFIKIAVDQTMQHVIQNEIDVFEGLYPAKIKPIYTTETEAIELLKKDSVRLIVTARKLSDAEMNYFLDKKFQPKNVRVAIDGVALIINPQNPDSIINVESVKKILTGEVSQWKQIYPGSKLGKIQVVFDNTKSSIVRYAIDSICRDKPISQNLSALELNEQVVDYVSKTPGSMGFIGVNLISDDADTSAIDFTKKIQVMRVSREDKPDRFNSVQPYQYYIYTHQYPFVRDIYMIVNDPRGELPKGFSRFVSSDKGQRIIRRAGLLPSTMPISTVQIREE
ncbi:MAG: phosphate transporter substrate-binding protein [Bacteroidetes bacterium]|nr:phosphate transporter substrate-binding protein [Bacteroidota bacterium]